MRVHLVPKGTMPALPALRKGDQGAKLQGGLCPRGMRTQWTNMAGQHKPMAKPAPRYAHTSAEWYRLEREFKQGRRAYDQ